MMLGAEDFWDVSGAAGAAAGFAGLLAAIVLIVNAQLAQHRSTSRSLSRLLAPIGLVVLLVAAYEFILLSGEPSPQDLLSPAADGVARQLLAEVRRTAPLFTIAGSLLAIGAVLSVLIIVVAVEETQASRAPVTAAVFYVALLAAAIFLLFGYDDARSSLSEAKAGLGWWVSHVAAISVLFATSLRSQWRTTLSLNALAELNDQRARRLTGIEVGALVCGLCIVLIVPVLLYVLVSNGVDVAIDIVTLGAALWFGCGTSLLVNTLWTFDPAKAVVDE